MKIKEDQNLKNILGQNVKSRRDQRGWNQEELSVKARVTKNTISNIETGQKFARAITLVRLAKAFETHVYELLKPRDILPDKPTDLFARYNQDVQEKMAEIGNSYIEKMKG